MNAYLRTLSISLVLSAFSLLIMTGCDDESSSENNPTIESSVDLDRVVNYYHWKSDFMLSTSEKDQLNALGSRKMYVRFFDLKWVASENQAFPFATVEIPSTVGLGSLTSIVPTVYITNECMQKVSSNDIQDLAYRIVGLIQNKAYELESKGVQIDEYQFDCDWTDGTREKYFQLLEAIKKNIESRGKNLNLSCTIRLHQVKYFERTGVPPVSRGMLMFYNMGKINDPNEENSILNLETAEKYMENFDDYPLELDIALPLFNWGVQFRDDKIIRILNSVQQQELEAHDQIELVEDRKYKVLESTYINGNFVYKNDVIKLEGPKKEDLIAALKMLDGEVKGNPDVIFYHLNQRTVSAYPPETISEIVRK